MDGGSAEAAGRVDEPATGITERDVREHEVAAGRHMAAEEARRAAKLPKTMLQKFSEKGDVESYLNMFEHVAIQ